MSTIALHRPQQPPSSPGLDAFEQVYRCNIDVIVGYFARRCREPQTVGDLTSETFLRALEGFSNFDPCRGSARAWLFGIAHHVFAHHCRRSAGHREAIAQLGGHRDLDDDELDELAERIDAEREGAALLACCGGLPANERRVIELVDLAGLNAREAAASLGISHAACRQRLSRARAHLRRSSGRPDQG